MNPPTNKKVLEAWNELQAIGAPILSPDLGWGGDFAISGELYGEDDGFYTGSKDKDPDGAMWADYYNEGISPHITAILSKHGMSCEWYNPAVLCVGNL